MSAADLRTAGRTIPFYRDVRIIGLLVQLAFLVGVIVAGSFLVNNMVSGLRASNIPLGWNFLRQEAGFEIAEGPAFNPAQSYGRAFLVGIANTIRVAVIGIVLATLVGLVMGIARLSNNWLARTLAGAYVEVVRNTPLLVQLFFWYFAVILKLPNIQASIAVPGVALLSNRGVGLTWPRISAVGQPLVYWLLGAVVVAVILGLTVARWRARQGGSEGGIGLALLAFCAVAVLGYGVTAATGVLPANTTYTLQRGDRGLLFADHNGDGLFNPGMDQPLRFIPVTLLSSTGAEMGTAMTDEAGSFRFFDLDGEGASLIWETPGPIIFDRAVLQGFNYRGGVQLSPEFAALLVGLTIYTGAFIAEVVRAGINAVPKGQWEASRAVGLSGGKMLRLVILPQALRVIIPPLTSQYLNLTKNSSLAIAVGYPDLFNVSRTVFNQSGATVQMFILIMATYLIMSLLTSAFMNWYNRRVALVER